MEKLRGMIEVHEGKRELWGLHWHDILIIFALWIINYVRPWFVGWHCFTYNLNLQQVGTFEAVVFACQCFMTVALSTICDLRHTKYEVYKYFLLLYGMFPIYGLVESILPSFTLRFMMEWLDSTSYVISPIQYCAIFIQKPNISRINCYIWLTIFELFGALNQFVVPFVIPYRCPLQSNSILSIWVVILLFYWQVVFYVYYISKFVKPEIFPEKKLKEAISGIIRDRNVDNDVVWWKFGRKTLKFSIFILLLIPGLFSILLMVSLKLMEIKRELNMQKFFSTSNMMPFGSFIGTALVATTLIFVRKVWPKISDVLTLGVPYILNLLAIIIMTVRLLYERPGEVIVGVVPDNSSMVVLFFNTDYNNRSACVYSDDFEPMRLRAMEHLTREVRTDKAEVKFAVVLDPIYENFVPMRYTLEVKNGSLITIFIQLGTIPLNRNFVINAVQLIRVEGAETIRPTEMAQYVWMTSISQVDDNTEMRITRGNNGSAEVREIPSVDKAIAESALPVFTKFSLVHKVPAKGDEFVIAEVAGIPKPWTVYAVLIHEHNQEAKLAVKRQRIRPSIPKMWSSTVKIHVIVIMKLARAGHHRIPSREILRTDPIIIAAYFIHGSASSLIQIGYLHLFWKDAPLRLRTCILAVFVALTWLLGLFPSFDEIDYYSGQDVVSLRLNPLYGLVAIQFAVTLMHFVLARLYYLASYLPHSTDPTAQLSAYESAQNEPELPQISEK